MVSIIALAALGALAGAGATAAATGDLNTAAQMAANAVPPGLHIALAHVPSWTHAHQVLTEHLKLYAQNGSIGAGTSGGLGTAIKSAAKGLKR
ncbi:MAG: hypothetical protein QXR69_02740 [Conexivisphaerales archaeon]